MAKCPDCGTEGMIESARFELCEACGHEVYYGDAHASGRSQISRVNGVPVCNTPRQEQDHGET